MPNETAPSQFDIIVIGELPLDIIKDVQPEVRRPGGAAYSACAAAVKGAKVGIISDVGTDGTVLLSQVSELGVDIAGVEAVAAQTIAYDIRNSDESNPQIVSGRGLRWRPNRSLEIPPNYLHARSLLIYPYQPDVIRRVVPEIRRQGAKLLFDLQHDIGRLEDWSHVLSVCDVVLTSRTELLSYTNTKDEQQAVETLRKLGANTVVVKYGMGGSAIYERARLPVLIPAFACRFRCTIGAGDIYNAIFALHFVTTGDLTKSALQASIAASIFIEHLEFAEYIAALSTTNLAAEMARREAFVAPPERLVDLLVYMAGPFQSSPQRQWLDRVVEALEIRGFKVFSPYRDAGVLESNETQAQRQLLFKADLSAIDGSFALVLLDGAGRGGSSWEAGYAYARDVPIFALRTDKRQPWSNMLTQSSHTTVSTIPQLLNELFSYVMTLDSFQALNSLLG